MPLLPYTYEELLGSDVAKALATDSDLPAPGGQVTVYSALSGRPLPPLAPCSAADARAAVARGREANAPWMALGIDARLAIGIRLRGEIITRGAMLAKVLGHSAGLGGADAAEECQDAERILRHATKRPLHAMRRWRRSPCRTLVPERAAGSAVTISYGDDARPLTSLFEGAMPALLAGGAVVTEVSARSAPVALAVAAMARSVGLPAGVWQMTVRSEAPNAMSGSGLRAVLTEHADALAPLCCPPDTSGPQWVRPQPPNLLVLRHDGSARAAARGAVRACFARAGRGCAATPLVAVHASRIGEFAEHLTREAAVLTCATALPDKHHLKRLSDWVDMYVAAGARSLLPNRSTPGHRPGEALPVPRPVLLVDRAALSDPRPQIPLGPIALLTQFTHWAEVLEQARLSGRHVGIYTRSQLPQLTPQFASLPACRIHLNQPPRAGLLL